MHERVVATAANIAHLVTKLTFATRQDALLFGPVSIGKRRAGMQQHPAVEPAHKGLQAPLTGFQRPLPEILACRRYVKDVGLNGFAVVGASLAG
jgi:hypothetical protein